MFSVGTTGASVSHKNGLCSEGRQVCMSPDICYTRGNHVQANSEMVKKAYKTKRSNHDGASWLEPYKNNGILTSRQGTGVPNAGRLEAPAERHRGHAIFRSYQLWLEFPACAGSRTAPRGTSGDQLECAKMVYMLCQKIPENG